MLELTEEELWCIYEYVRMDSGADEYGEEWDKEFELDVMGAILNAKDGKPADTYFLTIDTEMLWRISRQVPDDFVVGNTYVGRDVLRKTFAALHKDVRPSPDGVPISNELQLQLNSMWIGGDNSASDRTYKDTNKSAGEGEYTSAGA